MIRHPFLSRRDRSSLRGIPMVTAFCLQQLLLVVVVLTSVTTNVLVVVTAVRNIQVAFPLQSLTIWDSEVLLPVSSSLRNDHDDDSTSTTATTTTTTEKLLEEPSPFSFRARFLTKFQKGLQAEVTTRNLLQQQQQPQISSSDGKTSGKGKTIQQKKHWATLAALNDQKKHRTREAIVEKAYDDAIQQHEQQEVALQHQTRQKLVPMKQKNPNRYQFVGVINSHPIIQSRRQKDSGDAAAATQADDVPITWYTRTKPKHAKWTIRLIHVNRAAILKDLYNQKKIDIFAQYQNESQDDNGGRPMITGQYRVRERSWKNLWNMSLKHMFTDSSGMYWRERRIHSTQENDANHQNLYTDGNHVYEATYRYMPDGRNGMHKVSTLAELLNSRSIDPKMKQRILQRLQQDTPDIVLEE